MANEINEYRPSERIEHHLKELREDYLRVEGKPFHYFFCPILFEDKPVPLCLGHIINEACPNSFRGCVVQRADVDQSFGLAFESDFTGNVQARSMSPREALLDRKIKKKISPKIIVNGKEWKHYEDRGEHVPGHTKVALHIGEGEPLLWMVKKTQEEINILEKTEFQLAIGKDCRVSSVVSLIKAAYLTLFKLLGYSYILSTAGKSVGQEMLGKFFREHGQKNADQMRKEAVQFFRPHVNMIRTIDGFGGTPPLGTIEDQRATACSADGKVFGITVYIRANAQYFGVLMPCFEEAESQAAYYEFIQNNNQALCVHDCTFQNKGLVVAEESREIFWPKNDAEFNFD